MQSRAARKAAAEQGRASERALEEERRQYDQARADIEPWRTSGMLSLAELNRRMGFGDIMQGGTFTPPPAAPTMEEARDRAFEAVRNENIARGTPYGAVSTDEIEQRASHIFVQMQTDHQSRLEEWRKAGGAASGGEGELLRTFTKEDLARDPVYQSGLEFGLGEGREAINARAIAGGGYDSGATLKALTRFGTDYGSTKANEAYNRFVANQSNIYNKLAGISGTGQVATGQIQAAGTNYANQAADLLTGAGNARAAGIVGGANAWSNALSSGGTGAANYYQNNKILEELMKRRNSSGYNANANYQGQNLDQPDYSPGFY